MKDDEWEDVWENYESEPLEYDHCIRCLDLCEKSGLEEHGGLCAICWHHCSKFVKK